MSATIIDDARTSTEPGPVLVPLDSVEPKRVEWLWNPRLPLGKLAIIAGDGGLGKSLVTLDVAARVSTGKGWPDQPDECFNPVGVLLLSAEDDIADTIRPRLDAAGADVSRIVAMQGVRTPDARGTLDERFTDLARDVQRIEEAVAGMSNCGLVIIDPVSAYTGKIDSHNNSEVRGMLAPLARLAEEHRVCVLMVHHLNKGQGQGGARKQSMLHRVMGSVAWATAARAVLAVAKDKDDPARRLMLTAKNNLGPDTGGLAYRIGVNDKGQPCVEWDSEPVDMSADDVLNDSDEDKGAADRAVDWLKSLLADGPMTAVDVEAAAKRDGHKTRTVHRAKDRAGALSVQQRDCAGITGWVWKLRD